MSTKDPKGSWLRHTRGRSFPGESLVLELDIRAETAYGSYASKHGPNQSSMPKPAFLYPVERPCSRLVPRTKLEKWTDISMEPCFVGLPAAMVPWPCWVERWPARRPRSCLEWGALVHAWTYIFQGKWSLDCNVEGGRVESHVCIRWSLSLSLSLFLSLSLSLSL